MFIIERALNIFTLIYEMEYQLKVNNSQISIDKLDNKLNQSLRSDSESNILVPQSSFSPNQLILNAALVNAIKQNHISEDKKLDEGLRSSEYSKSNANESSEKKANRIPSFSVIDSPNLTVGEVEKQNQLHSSPKNPIESTQQNFVSALSSPNASYIGSQIKQETKPSKYTRDIGISSPRFVRVNNNLIDNTLNQKRVLNPDVNIDRNLITASPKNIKYDNTNINGSNKRTVWPNANLMVNGGIGDPLSSPVSLKSRSAASHTIPEQVVGYPTGNTQVNNIYKPTANISVTRYIEQKKTEGFVSPMGFSPLASPTYRKNFSQGRPWNQNKS